MKKQARVKYHSREQVETAFLKAINLIRKTRGFVNIDVKATIRVHDVNDPEKAIVLQSKHAI